MNKELEAEVVAVLHGDADEAIVTDDILFEDEVKSWKALSRALQEYFTHSCEEGTCEATYDKVQFALDDAVDTRNALSDYFEDGE